MGSYTSLELDGYQIHTSKSLVDPVVMTVFRESDRSFRLSSENAPTEWRHEPPIDADENDVDHAYAAPVWIIRDRLEVMGFTLSAAKSDFEASRMEKVSRLRTWRAEHDEAKTFWAADELLLLETLTFSTWLEAFVRLKRNGKMFVTRDTTPGEEIKSYYLLANLATPLEKYMLSDDQDKGHFGFLPSDFRFFLRAVLESCDSDGLLVQDITEVVGAGIYDPAELISEISIEELTSPYPYNAPIIVLTEGSTDRWSIQGALRVLYPHLSTYYSFMDFEGMAAPGSAAQLVATVKAFAGAGITNRVVALFDNDTAARDALRSMERLQLPSNFRVLTYPPIDSARTWPTIGPTGTASFDVNGLAGSIELYFGLDVLRRPDGELVPVQWKGFVPAMKQYQGEVLNKQELQERFRKKLAVASASSVGPNGQDWSGMRVILDSLRSAFATDRSVVSIANCEPRVRTS